MEPITTTEWMVIFGGLTGIAWVNWYFFLAGNARVENAFAATDSIGHTAEPAQITITVDGGYSPQQVRVNAGAPVRLIFDRKDTGSCSEEIVLPDFNIRKFLPTGQQTVVQITPAAAGRYEFTCGMSMLRGVIIAEA